MDPDLRSESGECIPFTAPSKAEPLRLSSRPLSVQGPSSLYRGSLWHAGQVVGRRAPVWFLTHLMRNLATGYAWSHPNRLRIVKQNIAPALADAPKAVSAVARQLFRQFGQKLADLWRYESGLPIYNLFHDLVGWEHLVAAQARGNGVLLLTLHLGNWEFGAPLLTERGIQLQVITMAEPETQLNDLRQRARARWGVQTLTLGNHPFAAVEVLKKLNDNHCVALLVDRPPEATAMIVRLFERPFLASVSAAELARASGCALVPVLLPRTKNGYVARILPAIDYNRRALRAPSARTELTQRIVSAFEPSIRLYLNQWYHFVPIWPHTTSS